jgi:sulfur-carrier protein
VRVHVKYFASIREALGMGGETVDTAAPTLAALRDELLERGCAGGDEPGAQRRISRLVRGG